MVPSRLLFVGNFLSASMGVRSIGEELSDRLQRAGHTVITTSAKTGRFSRLLDMIATIKFQRSRYDIACVEVYSGLAFTWSYISAGLLKFLRKKVILTLHGGKLPEFSRHHPRVIQKLLLAADVVTTPSRYLQHAFQETRSSIIYLPNGIDIARYPVSTKNVVKPSLVWLRAFHSIYAPEAAIECLNQLHRDYPNAVLTMIGPDKRDGSFKKVLQKIDEYGLAESVKITGAIPKSKVGEYLSRGDIFLNTTLYESFGVSVLEAAACGLCIVTTNVGELPYLWQDGEEALLVPPNDADAMASAVKRIIEEPGLAEKLSRNARSKAEQYDWSVILPQWERLIESIA